MSDDDSLSLPRRLGSYTLTEAGVEWRVGEPPLRWQDITRFSIIGDLLKGRGVALHGIDEAAFEGGFGVPDTKAPKPRVILYARGTGQTPEGLMLLLEQLREQHGIAPHGEIPKKKPPPPPPSRPEARVPESAPEVPPPPEQQPEQEPELRPNPRAKQQPGSASNTNRRVVTRVSRSYSSTSVNIRNGRIMDMVAVKVDGPQTPHDLASAEPVAQATAAGPLLFVAGIALLAAVFFESYRNGVATFLCMLVFMAMLVAAYRQRRHWTRNLPFRSKMLVLFLMGGMWSLFWSVMACPWVGYFGMPFVIVCGPLFFIATFLV